MLNFHNRKSVIERNLREKLKDDRARTQFGRIGNFGIVRDDKTKIKGKFSEMEYGPIY